MCALTLAEFCALMFGNCQCAFMIGQLLFMFESPPTLSPSLCHPLRTLSDANLHACSTSQDSRRGGRGRDGKRWRGMKGAGVGRSTGEGGDRENGKAPSVT